MIASGCAAAGPSLSPITDPAQRVDVPGLSILPPQGDNWFRASSPRQQEDRPGIWLIQFVKKLWDAPPTGPEDARLVVALVTAHDISDEPPTAFESADAFLDWVSEWGRNHLGQMITHRRRLIDFDATRDDSLGATCARYTRVTEQIGWGPFPGSLFILATRGLLCLHPHWPRHMINVGYTQLYLKGQEPLLLDAEVEPFLKSPVFTAQRPVAESPTPARWVSQMRTGGKAADGQRWSEAEAAFKVALAEAERAFEPQDRRLAHTLYSLALVYGKQGRWAEVEPLYRRALAIYEQHPGADQRRYGQTLNDLGYLYMQQGQHEQAEALLRRSLAVREVALGPDDLDVARVCTT